MAPRAPSIDQTTEYDDFIARLQAFHDERGTNFDAQPKVGSRRVDLFRLYKKVTSEGGYDAVSDTKSNKLAWRRIGQELSLGSHNLATVAFSLKTAYYKNLAAFEIKDFHLKDPPPKEILEEVSAKGGNLLGRTVDNFKRPISREERFAANGIEDDESEEDEEDTPGKDKMEIDEPESSSRRAGLRHAPPQRVLFDGSTSGTRSTRQVSAQGNSPAPQPQGMQPTINGAYSSSMGLSQTLANYEPKQNLPLTLRPVMTPANNPEGFKAKQKELRDKALEKMWKRTRQQNKHMMLPGTGFTGPSIYSRTLLSLKSGMLEEQEFSLHHLVKISHERGDKYRFQNFGGLAEALIGKVLEVTSLFSHGEWVVTYQEDLSVLDPDYLDGLRGTSDILERIRSKMTSSRKRKLDSEEFDLRLKLINEAGLVLRNMVMMPENADFLSRYPAIRDTIIIILNLPNDPETGEIQHYILEIAEQLSKFMSADPDDPLYQTLLATMDSTDRSTILTCLRTISRLDMQSEHPIPLQSIPAGTIKKLCEWILMEDEEMRNAILELLYRFTTIPENVEFLMDHVEIEGFVRQLVRLLFHGARHEELQQPRPPQERPPIKLDAPIPRISRDHIEQLLGYDEPERSSQWLRACFEEDDRGEVTQIALWQAYQVPFSPYAQQRPLLPAKDFITNVSNTIPNARAEVINIGPNQHKFVIQGIKPRALPLDPKGRPYMRCLWHLEPDKECGEFALWAKHMWEHIITQHLNIAKGDDGQFDFTPTPARIYDCNWAGCNKFSSANELASPFTVGMHVKTHLPDSSEKYYLKSKHNVSSEDQTAPQPTLPAWTYNNTQMDAHHNAAGLPLISLLVLRNLARNIPKTTAGTKPGGETLVGDIFAPVKGQLYSVMAHNLSLRNHLPALTKAIEAYGG